MSKKSNKDFPKHPRSTISLPTPKSDKQKDLLKALNGSTLIVIKGPAGVGKTYLPVFYAAKMLLEGRIDRIILTRPNIATGKSLGFFPGSLEEKMEPWTAPILEILKEALGKGVLESQIKNGNIVVCPFETIRGHTFKNSFVILDEAQNTTHHEMKAFVTRIGENSKVVINGDVTQSDIKDKVSCGLSHLVYLCKNSDRLRNYTRVIEFGYEDIVRSELCKILIEEFDSCRCDL